MSIGVLIYSFIIVIGKGLSRYGLVGKGTPYGRAVKSIGNGLVMEECTFG